MSATRRELLRGGTMLAAGAFAAKANGRAQAASPRPFGISTPMDPPEWALLQRELIAANAKACEDFFARYFDSAGWLRSTVRWGANDGPDDAIENCNDWPHLFMLGGPDNIRDLYERAFEGHVRQYTAARTTEVPLGREGMYSREFITHFDWQHNAEAMSVFNLMGLTNPYDPAYRDRAKRFAGFYTGEDPLAPNYDRKLRIMRSMFTGSKGPLLRRTTPLDWAGDPFDATQFLMLHGEDSYEETLAHYAEYGDTACDSPLNMNSTTLGLNAFMLDGEEKYRDWLLGYVDGWAARAKANDDILPSKVGLDGAIGGDDGKWYGGTYGWGFSPHDPVTGKLANRNRIHRMVMPFMNAFLLSGGDQRYLDVWRRQSARIDAQARTVGGVVTTPRMFGDDGWYDFQPGLHRDGAFEVWYMSMRADDRARAGEDPWVSWLEGDNPDYPVTALKADLARVQDRVRAREMDRTTPETRLVDATLDINPASVKSLIQLMEGGLHIARPGWTKTSPALGGAPLHCRVRWFDPVRRRPGVPEDVAVLVHTMDGTNCAVTLVNLNPYEARELVVQGGAYGEHRIDTLTSDGDGAKINARHATIRLAPGAGSRIDIAMTRYANRPTLDLPWSGIG